MKNTSQNHSQSQSHHRNHLPCRSMRSWRIPHSVGDRPQSSNNISDDRKRLWSYLASNICQAVEELCHLCEEERSIERCQEAIELLTQCQTQFRTLQITLQEKNIATTLETGNNPSPGEVGKFLKPVSKLSATAAPFHPQSLQIKEPQVLSDKPPPVLEENEKSTDRVFSEVVACQQSPESPRNHEEEEPLPVSIQSDNSEVKSNDMLQPIENSTADCDEELEEEDDGDENSEDTDALQVALESEFVWAETEAWVEAELLAEEEAWRDLLPPEILTEDNPDSIPSPESSPRNLYPSIDVSPDTKGSVSVLTPEISEDEESVPPSISHLSLESPFLSSKSPSRLGQRRLHEKLSSPDRGALRSQLTPDQVKLRNEIRQSIAESNRDKTVREIKQKAMVVSNRIKASEMREAQRIALAEQVYRHKLEEAEKRHHEYIKNIRGRAWNENTKVSEVLFINSLNEDALAAELQRTLIEVEGRILAGRKRREELLTGISAQQKKRNRRKVEQMSELRLNLEREKMERWDKIQRRLETVRVRREERLAELQRRSQEAKEKINSNSTIDSPPPVETDKVDAQEGKESQSQLKKDKRKKSLSSEEQDLSAKQKPHSKKDKEKVDPSDSKFNDATTLEDSLKESLLLELRQFRPPDQLSPKDFTFHEIKDQDISEYYQDVVEKIDLLLAHHINPQLIYNDTGCDDNLSCISHLSSSTVTSSSAPTSTKNSKRRKKKKKQALTDKVDPELDPTQNAIIDVSKAIRSFRAIQSEAKQQVIFVWFRFIYLMINKEFGCLSSSHLWDIFTGSQKLPAERNKKSHLSNHIQDSQNEASILLKFLLEINRRLSISCQPVEEIPRSIETEVLVNIECIFSSGVGMVLTDLMNYTLLLIYRWGEKFFPNILQKSKEEGREKIVVSDVDIQWPHFIKNFLPLLFSIFENIITISCQNFPKFSLELREIVLKWADYTCGAKLFDHLSDIFRELQCVTDFCEKDIFLSSIFCRSGQLIRNFSLLIIQMTPPTIPCPLIENEGHLSCLAQENLREAIIVCFQKNEIVWNLISLLGVLLLQDGVQSHSYRRQSHQPGSLEKFHIPSVPSLQTHPTQRKKSTQTRHSITSPPTLTVDSPSSSANSSISPAVLSICSEILSTLNQLCRLNVTVVQELPAQMQTLTLHVTERLIGLQKPSPKVIPSTRPKRKGTLNPEIQRETRSGGNVSDPLLDNVLSQTLIFIGYLCLLCPQNQSFLSSGTPPSLLVRLCNLPVQFFTDEKMKFLLFPTLIAFCFENDSNLSLLKKELNSILLSSFLRAVQESSNASLKEELSLRFPMNLWDRGILYFG